MCHACTQLGLDHCPPRARGDPDPALAAEIAIERDWDIAVEHQIRTQRLDPPVIDAVTGLVLYASLGRRDDTR